MAVVNSSTCMNRVNYFFVSGKHAETYGDRSKSAFWDTERNPCRKGILPNFNNDSNKQYYCVANGR